MGKILSRKLIPSRYVPYNHDVKTNDPYYFAQRLYDRPNLTVERIQREINYKTEQEWSVSECEEILRWIRQDDKDLDNTVYFFVFVFFVLPILIVLLEFVVQVILKRPPIFMTWN